MPSLHELTAQYPILKCLAEWLSTVDLYHLAITSRHNYDHILASKPVFDRLKRPALCDGRGLRQRQNFQGRYALYPGSPGSYCRDEPLEVRLWATKCDEAGALPCRKCGVNVCEECRSYNREPPDHVFDRRPHVRSSQHIGRVFCLCDACDAVQESQLQGQFLHELCDCDLALRWICSPCASEEIEAWREHMTRFTVEEAGNDAFDESDDCQDTKHLMDNPGRLAFFCPCGASVPKEAPVRCALCKRRHRDEDE